MAKHLTKRQQVKKWMEEKEMNISEESISYMFNRVMEVMSKYKVITLRQAFLYSYINMAQSGELIKIF